jgi:hypothetical protein
MNVSVSVPEELYRKAVEIDEAQPFRLTKSSPRPSWNKLRHGNVCNYGHRVAAEKVDGRSRQGARRRTG